MAVADWSTTPALNLALGSINLAEGATLVGDGNDIARQLMADIKTFSLTVANASTLVSRDAGVFVGTQPVYTGRGAYLHNNNPAHTSGRVFVQAEGGAVPAGMVSGDWLAEY